MVDATSTPHYESCFNGAADFHPRKLGSMRARWPSPPSCFNGAADFHPRKHHDNERTCILRIRDASMGPRTSIRGNGPSRHRREWPVRGQRCFNGAADFHPRKRWPTADPRLGASAGLQWGRGLPSAETIPHMGRDMKIRRASMGPRTSIRGNKMHIASHRCKPAVLQWGRGLPSAETTDAVSGWPGVGRRCFNGAADFHPRKQHAFEVFSCQRLALPLASAGRQTVDWTKRTLVPNPQLHACQHLPAASGHRVFALTSTLAPAAKAAHRVSNPW